MTNMSELYDIFMSKISDYSFLQATRQEIEADLYSYYKSASANFLNCKQDLSTVKEENETYVVSDLTPYEIEVIVKLMLVEYMTPIVLSTEVLKQSLSDKDFRIYSQANQLRELNLLYRLLKKQAEKMMTKYSYLGMTDNDYR